MQLDDDPVVLPDEGQVAHRPHSVGTETKRGVWPPTLKASEPEQMLSLEHISRPHEKVQIPRRPKVEVTVDRRRKRRTFEGHHFNPAGFE